MYYVGVVAYDTDRATRSGKIITEKQRVLLEAESMEEATIVLANYRYKDTRESRTVDIKELNIDDIILPSLEKSKEYYKK